jgi:Tol biopolymer transport system component
MGGFSVAVVPIDGEAQARLVTSDPFRDTAPRWSPDGVRIAFCSDREGGNGIWTIDQDGTGLARVAALEGPGASFPVWSPGGDRIAFAQGGASPRLARAGAGGGPAGIEPLERADVTAPAGTSPLPDSFEPWSWSSDGDRIAGTAGGIGIYTLSDGAYRKMSTSGAHPTWLPDGQHLLYTDDRTLYLLDTRTRESRVLYDAIPEDLPFGVTVAKDGRTVYASLSGTPGEIWEVKIKE